MAATFKGVGTVYYGEADRREDGTFLSTEFVCVAFLPIWPLCTRRLRRKAQENRGITMPVHEEPYDTIERLPIAWHQVARVYIFIICAFLWYSYSIPKVRPGGGLIGKEPDGKTMLFGVLAFTVVLLLPFLYVYLVRWLAWRSVNRRYDGNA